MKIGPAASCCLLKGNGQMGKLWKRSTGQREGFYFYKWLKNAKYWMVESFDDGVGGVCKDPHIDETGEILYGIEL